MISVTPDTMLFYAFEITKYAPYVKELQSVFQAKACFVIIIEKFLKFSIVSVHLICCRKHFIPA